MHDSIATVFSLALTVLGLSYLLQARAWASLYVDFEMHPRRFIPTGLLMFVSGLFIAITFDDWSSTWPIFITAFGWLMAIEGGVLSLKPSLLGGFTRLLDSHLVRYIRLGGLLVFGLGCLLTWEYVLRNHF
jgi:hypothetical protein